MPTGKRRRSPSSSSDHHQQQEAEAEAEAEAEEEVPKTHPRIKYAEKPPDFAHLASLYPSFQPYVFSRRGCNNSRPAIDWTDFNATRELTRVLLHHDFSLQWWIPDGQLCPTVPNRSNYIHWIEDLLACDIIVNEKKKRKKEEGCERIRGFDIGTGANCIYPLIGASLHGWSFVGSDVTVVALEWAKWNVESNPHLADLTEIRSGLDSVVVNSEEEGLLEEESSNSQVSDTGLKSETVEEHNVAGNEIMNVGSGKRENDNGSLSLASSAVLNYGDKVYEGPPVLLGVVKNGEFFDFCMCNPPFFESMDAAGANPKTSCGGTEMEMVCTGGELAFITRIVEDSIQLKDSFRRFTSMVGRKANLKILVSKLRKLKVSIVKTTEFVQGYTSRWGLAWSFIPPTNDIMVRRQLNRTNRTFMLEGLRQYVGATQVLQSVELLFGACGASCKLNMPSFFVDISASAQHCETLLSSDLDTPKEVTRMQSDVDCPKQEVATLSLRVSVFEQIPGTLLVKGSVSRKEDPMSDYFSAVFLKMEKILKSKFSMKK